MVVKGETKEREREERRGGGVKVGEDSEWNPLDALWVQAPTVVHETTPTHPCSMSGGRRKKMKGKRERQSRMGGKRKKKQRRNHSGGDQREREKEEKGNLRTRRASFNPLGTVTRNHVRTTSVKGTEKKGMTQSTTASHGTNREKSYACQQKENEVISTKQKRTREKKKRNEMKWMPFSIMPSACNKGWGTSERGGGGSPSKKESRHWSR